ncbi:MAG: fasciclin domain-containing protein [Prolixibacteraceae bacterium]|jgi:uncharacterized surface protein with fasciclin (FAS1) repeats|nr:fasciclin domain-containing protein [Prolixibacteraceae bacterium]
MNCYQKTQKGKNWQRQSVLSHLLWFIIIGASIGLINACDSDDVGDNYYTFTGKTMGQYIDDKPEEYSEFSKMLDTTGVKSLLNAYGKYTCFLPNNKAVFDYYEHEGFTSVEDMSLDSIRKLVYNHIIKDNVLETDLFANGFIPNLTMNGRYLRVGISNDATGLVYTINLSSKISKSNLEVHNGVIHEIDQVLSPTENSLVEAIADDEKFSLFYRALIATDLGKELLLVEDDSYVPDEILMERDGVVQGHGILTRIPREKKYGFTALMPSDETFAQYGISSIEDMTEYAKEVYDDMYPEDAGITDITNRKNSLNRLIAYHLVNKKITRRLFIEAYDNTGQNFETTGETHSIKYAGGQSIDMFEYIEPMCPNTLIEVRTLRTTNEYDIFNMITETGEAVRLTSDYDNDALNGVYHEIDGILAYTRDVEREIISKRIRMDGASFFPELTNNNMRVGSASKEYPSIEWDFPSGYIERVKTSETTVFGYITPDDRFQDYQGDEIFLTGLYEFTITTLPIPAGTYEIRFGYQPTIYRGVAQMYWDGMPCGIPLNLSLYADNPKIGHVVPGIDPTDPNGFENDKMMRNRGYMKAPASFRVIKDDWYTGIARNSDAALRKILGIYTFDKMKTHEFSVKAAQDGQFMFDYLEFVPLEVIEKEDIY